MFGYKPESVSLNGVNEEHDLETHVGKTKKEELIVISDNNLSD